MSPERERLETNLEYALAKLREGTEVLRTGGGTTLNAGECNAVLDQLEQAEQRESRWREVLARIQQPSQSDTVWILARFAGEALAAQSKESEGTRA